jgi:DNA replication protein DnaC
VALSTSQYNMLMREYEERRFSSQRDLTKRLEELYSIFPRIKKIQEEISALSVSEVKNRLLKNSSDEDIKKKIHDLSEEKEKILLENGYNKDYLKPVYVCKDCKDTAYIGNEKCHCLKEKIIDLLYDQSNIKAVLKNENFNHFNIDLYSENDMDEITKISARENIKEVLLKARNFVSDFKRKKDNLLIFGATGVGKTYLTNCIAKEIMDAGNSVIYVSAIRLFEILADDMFSKKDTNENEKISKDFLDCDLLIIDDLGTELVNSFTSSAFFNCINERYLRNKSVVISTNLSLGELKNTYSERVFSRITSNYILLKIFGKDLRVMRSLGLTK